MKKIVIVTCLISCLFITGCASPNENNTNSSNNTNTIAPFDTWNDETIELMQSSIGEYIPYIELESNYASSYDQETGIFTISDSGENIIDAYQEILIEEGFNKEVEVDKTIFTTESITSYDSLFVIHPYYNNGNVIEAYLVTVLD